MQEQIEICREICKKITKETISAADFFSYRGIDTSFVQLTLNVKKHGTQALNDYLTYFSHYHRVKKSISEQFRKSTLFHLPQEHILWIKYLSMLEMGIGESDVLSHGLCYQLLNQPIPLPFSILAIENAKSQKHYLILLSPVMPEKNDDFTDALAQLPADAIIIDPYLQFVNYASLYRNELQHVIDTHQFKKISNIQSFSPITTEHKINIERHVKHLCSKLKPMIRDSSDPIEELRWSIFYNSRTEITAIINKIRQSESLDEVERKDTTPTLSC